MGVAMGAATMYLMDPNRVWRRRALARDRLNHATLALVGTVMLTVLLIAGFIFDVLNVLRGLVPATRLLTSFIYAFAGLSAVVFLYAFHKAQS